MLKKLELINLAGSYLNMKMFVLVEHTCKSNDFLIKN